MSMPVQDSDMGFAPMADELFDNPDSNPDDFGEPTLEDLMNVSKEMGEDTLLSSEPEDDGEEEL